MGTVQPVVKVSRLDDCNQKGEPLGMGTPKVDKGDKLPDHLMPLVQSASENLSNGEKHRLMELIGDFEDIFVGPDGKLGQTNLAEHYIDTGDAKPFKLPARRIPMFKRPIVEKEVDRMLDQGVIEHSTSPCRVHTRQGNVREIYFFSRSGNFMLCQ